MPRAGSSAAAGAGKKPKYSDPSSFANQGPAEVTFFMWPAPEADEEEDVDGEDDEDEAVVPGSLQDILDTLENERSKAAHEALNPPQETGLRSMTVAEGRRIIDDASKPYREKMEEARHKFVAQGTMTAEEAKAVVGQKDEDRRERRRAKRELQMVLNRFQKEHNKAVDLALNRDGTKSKDGEGSKDKDASFVPPRVVTEKGFPVTKAGMEKFFEIQQEVEKRDQYMHDMYIYNDFSGHGVTEVLENTLASFHKLIFKKDVSPLEKWAIVEGLVVYLAMGDHMQLMMNDNSDGISEVFEMMGVMFVTALEMLQEASLIGPESPLPDNVGVMTLFFLDFMTNTAENYDLEWVHEIVRAADTYDVDLTPSDQIEGIDQDIVDGLREICEEQKKAKGFTWKTAFPKFKREHPSGHHYDITRMSEKDKAQYLLSRSPGDMSEDMDEMSVDSDSD